MKLEKYILMENGKPSEYITRIPESIHKVCSKHITLFDSEKSLHTINFEDGGDYITFNLGKYSGNITILKENINLLSKLLKIVEITEGKEVDIKLERINE